MLAKSVVPYEVRGALWIKTKDRCVVLPQVHIKVQFKMNKPSDKEFQILNSGNNLPESTNTTPIMPSKLWLLGESNLIGTGCAVFRSDDWQLYYTWQLYLTYYIVSVMRIWKMILKKGQMTALIKLNDRFTNIG